MAAVPVVLVEGTGDAVEQWDPRAGFVVRRAARTRRRRLKQVVGKVVTRGHMAPLIRQRGYTSVLEIRHACLHRRSTTGKPSV